VTGIRLRPATRADDAFFREMEFQATWESLEDSDRERIRPEALHASLRETHDLLLARPGNRVLIAEDEAGTRIGLLWFGMNRNLVTGEDEAWIYNISVVPEFRGRGLGRELMHRAEALARQEGYRVIGLMVAAHNAPARRLYERMEYDTSTLLMRKRLDRR